jgi:hypothetical protein
MGIKAITGLVLLVLFVGVPFVSFAQTPPTTGGVVDIQPLTNIPGLTDGGINTTDLSAFFNTLYKYGVGLAGTLAVIFLMYYGFQYMTSQTPFKLGQSKDRLWEIFIGLLIVLTPIIVFGIINPKIFSFNIELFKSLALPQDVTSGPRITNSDNVPINDLPPGFRVTDVTNGRPTGGDTAAGAWRTVNNPDAARFTQACINMTDCTVRTFTETNQTYAFCDCSVPTTAQETPHVLRQVVVSIRGQAASFTMRPVGNFSAANQNACLDQVTGAFIFSNIGRFECIDPPSSGSFTNCTQLKSDASSIGAENVNVVSKNCTPFVD